jgi:uncharacterized membrane protein
MSLKDNFFLLFVLMTVLCWGTYVPTVHHGQKLLGGGKNPRNGAFQAFVMISGAYLVLGLIVLAATLVGRLETVSTDATGWTWAFFGGTLGAVGALGIVLALKNGGTPTIVPALVFAGAPIVNVFVSMWWNPPAESPRPLFWVGILLASVGTGIVLFNKPADRKPAPAATSAAPVTPTPA